MRVRRRSRALGGVEGRSRARRAGLRTAVAAAVLLAAATASFPATAHHGWGFYDTDTPLVFVGELVAVDYTNPHPEVMIEVAADSDLDPASLPVPEPLVELGFDDVLARARPASAGRWTLDLAPISRLNRWGMPRAPEVGDPFAAIGFASCDEAGVARPSLIVLDGVGVRQQSVRLPPGCSGEPRG